MTVVPMMMLVLLVMLLALAVVVCLGVWTYRDAKARGLEAGVWTAVVVLVPSFVGLLIYLLVGRRRAADAPRWVRCPRCGARTEAGCPFCSSCGADLGGEGVSVETDGGPDRPAQVSRAPIVAAIVCAVLAFVLVVGAAVLGIVTYIGPLDVGSVAVGQSVAVAQLETSSPTSWRFSAGYFSGSESRSVAVPEGGDAELHVAASVGEGSAELAILVDGEERQSFELGTSETPEVVDLSPYAAEDWITLQIRGDQARDVSVELDW